MTLKHQFAMSLEQRAKHINSAFNLSEEHGVKAHELRELYKGQKIFYGKKLEVRTGPPYLQPAAV